TDGRLLLARATATWLSTGRRQQRRRRPLAWTHRRVAGSEPPLSGADEDRLRPVGHPQPLVRLVQVTAHGAGRDAEIDRDVLVLQALGQPADGGELMRRQRAGLERARTVRPADRQVVHDLA